MPVRAFQPDLLFSGGSVHQGAALVVRDGRVESVGKAPDGAEQVSLRRRAILPGMVAAHSQDKLKSAVQSKEYLSKIKSQRLLLTGTEAFVVPATYT